MYDEGLVPANVAGLELFPAAGSALPAGRSSQRPIKLRRRMIVLAINPVRPKKKEAQEEIIAMEETLRPDNLGISVALHVAAATHGAVGIGWVLLPVQLILQSRDRGCDIACHSKRRTDGIGQKRTRGQGAGLGRREGAIRQILLGKPRQYGGDLGRVGFMIFETARDGFEKPAHVGNEFTTQASTSITTPIPSSHE